MRIGNIDGRLNVVSGERAWDVEASSGGSFSADPQAVYACWPQFVEWASAGLPGEPRPFGRDRLGPPVPRPAQVFAIGLNYRGHAAESGFAIPVSPTVFTKFVTAIAAPDGNILLPAGDVDWEVELVVVMGRQARNVAPSHAWSYVAGLTVGQDLSERRTQLAGPAPQFSLGKSFPGFAPIGPCLVTPDELGSVDDIEIGCSVNGEPVQKGHTRDLIFPVPDLIAYLSSVLTLLPGDVIFTGTPDGVGQGRDPQRFLAAGDELISYAAGIGEMRHRFTTPEP
jgi:2-keto-4-pentenoate hydratase/2-oxohepta-3-ene-1,7-dioic acid hydratase in catechol pathway